MWPEATRGCPILLASAGQPIEHQVAWYQENEQACFQGEVPSRRGRCLQNRHFWHRRREVRFCAGPVPNTPGIQADVGVSVSPGAREGAMPAFPDGCGTCNCSGISSCAGLTQARNGYCGSPDKSGAGCPAVHGTHKRTQRGASSGIGPGHPKIGGSAQRCTCSDTRSTRIQVCHPARRVLRSLACFRPSRLEIRIRHRLLQIPRCACRLFASQDHVPESKPAPQTTRQSQGTHYPIGN